MAGIGVKTNNFGTQQNLSGGYGGQVPSFQQHPNTPGNYGGNSYGQLWAKGNPNAQGELTRGVTGGILPFSKTLDDYAKELGLSDGVGGGAGGGSFGGMTSGGGLAISDHLRPNLISMQRSQMAMPGEILKNMQLQNQVLQRQLLDNNKNREALAQGYTQAMQSYISSINAGKNEALNYLNDAADISDEDLDSTINMLSDRFDTARGEFSSNLDAGIDAVEGLTDESREELRTSFKDAVSKYDPLSSITDEAVGAYKDYVLGGFDQQWQDYQNSPVYQARLDRAQQGIERSAAARGGLQSGAALQALQENAINYDAQNFNDFYNTRVSSLANLANLGATGNAAQAALLAQQGQSIADLNLQSSGLLANLHTTRGTGLADLYGSQAGLEAQAYNNRADRAVALGQNRASLAAQAAAQVAGASERGILGAAQTANPIYF